MLTDQGGYFNFEKLDPDENYSFKLEESKDMSLVLLDEDDLVIEQAVINDKGNLVYKKLTYQVANFEPLDIDDVELILSGELENYSGQVYRKLPGDLTVGMRVYVYNEDGDIVGTTLTDEEGKFEFNKLAADENYYFKIANNEGDLNLVTLDENDNIIEKTITKANGKFKYRKLGADQIVVLIEDEFDDHQLILIEEKTIDLDTFTVYYDYDAVELDLASKLKLRSFVKIMKGQPFRVEVHSYTGKRGSIEYNEKLSKQRATNVTKYLISMVLDPKNIIANHYGELKPVVDCDKKPCDDADHALNRRTVLKLIKL